MPKITLKDGHSFEADPTQRLVLALEDNGVDILHRCGGYARCTTCRVTFIEGEPPRMTIAERDRLSERDLLGQFRLSCQILCDHDMKIDVVNRLSKSDLPDAGERPKDELTPEPEWIDTASAMPAQE